MRVVIHESAAEATAEAVRRIAEVLRARPRAVLGLATGGTMEPVYEGLIGEARAGLDFSQATTFNLDEYVGLAPDHPQSYHSYMERLFFGRLDAPPRNRFVPEGDRDPEAAAADYEALLAAHGPIDLQLLGLGHNGHIGFNEPGSSLGSVTREKTLTRSTRAANARFFGPDEVPPRSAVTMGIGSILKAREIIVLALGASKAEAVAGVVEGPVSAFCPGSVLQFHPRVTLLVDDEASRGLRLGDFYREAVEMERAASV